MAAPFSARKRFSKSGANLTTGRFRVPSTVLISADLTIPSFPGNTSRTRAIL